MILAVFDETRNRIYSIAAIHELLYRSASFAEINMAEYARQLVPEPAQFYEIGKRVLVSVDRDSSRLEIQRAAPYGLLLNELVSNACKHAFPSGRPGLLTVTIKRHGVRIMLTVSDDGIGLPAGLDYKNSSTLGLKLVRLLASQLGGSVRLSNGAGTVVEVAFPQRLAEDRR